MTKREEIILRGTTDYNTSYPPRDAKKGYVAKINGTAAGALKYDREFFGDECIVTEGDEGLYERQRGDKKGGYTRWYPVIVSHPEHGLIIDSDADEAEVKKIAKLLDQGIAIQDAVEVTELVESEKTPGNWLFTAVARTASQASKAKKSATIDSAIEECWSVLSLMPEAEQKKILAALRKRVSPAKAKEVTADGAE
jgi:hypothetical protein